MAAECADVLYFAMVRCVAAGVDWKDVCKSLDLKALKLARRPGNDKKEYAAARARASRASTSMLFQLLPLCAQCRRASHASPRALSARTTQAQRCSCQDSRREEGRWQGRGQGRTQGRTKACSSCGRVELGGAHRRSDCGGGCGRDDCGGGGEGCGSAPRKLSVSRAWRRTGGVRRVFDRGSARVAMPARA